MGQSVSFSIPSLNIEDPAMVPTHLVWDLLTPQGAASLGEDLDFTVRSIYEM